MTADDPTVAYYQCVNGKCGQCYAERPDDPRCCAEPFITAWRYASDKRTREVQA